MAEFLFQVEPPTSKEKQRALLTAGEQQSTAGYTGALCAPWLCFIHPPGTRYTHIQHNPKQPRYEGIYPLFRQYLGIPTANGASLLVWIGAFMREQTQIQPLCPKQNSCAFSLPLSKTKYNSGSLDNRKLKNTPSEILTRIKTSSVIRSLISSLILVRFCKTLQLPAIHRLLKAAPSHAQLKSSKPALLTQELLVGTVICPARKIFIYRKAFEPDHYILT